MHTDQTDNLWSNPLVRHLTVIVAAKVLLLAVLWWAFFRIPADQGLSTADINTHIAGPGSGDSSISTE